MPSPRNPCQRLFALLNSFVNAEIVMIPATATVISLMFFFTQLIKGASFFLIALTFLLISSPRKS